jgi:hypothetical protein
MTGQVFGHGQQVIANVPFEYVRFDEQPLWPRFAQELLRIGHARSIGLLHRHIRREPSCSYPMVLERLFYCQIAGKGRLHR